MVAYNFETLLEQLAQGDVQAAQKVILAYEPYLRRVVRRQLPQRLRPKFDSVDIMQSVWADLLDGYQERGWQFHNADHLRAFLIRVTRNRFNDRFRQHRVGYEREESLGNLKADDQPLSPLPLPGEVLQAEELWEQLLAASPPSHHELLRLKRQGLALREIVARTGLHEGSVRRILRNLARKVALYKTPSAADHEEN